MSGSRAFWRVLCATSFRCTLPILALLALASCAAPQSKPPSVPSDVAAAEAAKQFELVAKRYFAQWARLYRVAEPINIAAAPFCGDVIRPVLGIHGYALSMVPKSHRPFAIRTFGLETGIKIFDMVHNGPAHQAGLRVGDVITRVGGRALPSDENASAILWAELHGGLISGQPVELTVRRGAVDRIFDVTPVLACDYNWGLYPSEDVQAIATGNAFFVYQGMMDFLQSDQHLAVVVAHELAHNTMRHLDAQAQNQLVGYSFGLLLDLIAAGFGENTNGLFSRLGASAGQRAFSVGFEKEADYVGLYFMGLAGWNLEGAADAWRLMGTRNPGAIAFPSTHPPTAQRYLALEAAAKEFQGKQQAGLPLVPEGVDLGADLSRVAFANLVSPAQQTATAQAATAEDLITALRRAENRTGRWLASGRADACGLPYEISLAIEGDAVEGSLRRGGVGYDLVGWLDPREARVSGRGAKDLHSISKQGPRLVEFDAASDGDAFHGVLTIRAAGRPACVTDITLVFQEKAEP